MKRALIEGDQRKWVRLKAAAAATGIPHETLRHAVARGAIRSRHARAKRDKPKSIIIWVDPDSLAAFQKVWRQKPPGSKRSPGRPRGQAKVNHRPKTQTALESTPKPGKAHK